MSCRDIVILVRAFNTLLTNRLLKTRLGDMQDGGKERRARDRLVGRGGADLPRLPWLADGQPHDAVTLIRQVLWRANTERDALELPDDLLAAVALLAAARA